MKKVLLTAGICAFLLVGAFEALAQKANINYVYDKGNPKPKLTFEPDATFLQAADCHEIVATPEVNIYTSYGKLQYDFGRSRAQLTGLGKKFGIVEQGVFAAGLAVVEVAWEISLNTLSHELANGKICVVPSSVDVFIGYQNPVIYVDKGLKPHSCEYNLVVRHEQTHQQINKAALDYFLPMFYDATQRIGQSIYPREVKKVDAIEQATIDLTQEYAQKLEPLVSLFKTELLLEQSKLDNHTNYEMEGRLCKKN